MLLRSETNRPSADNTTFYASGGFLQVVGDTTGVDKSTVSLAVHNADTILETSRKNALWDTNCRLARQYKYLLLTEFEGRTVSYGPSFSLLDLWPARFALGP